jgi:DNA-binding SARP family transcriptional activator/WD40 repeat protein
VRGGGEPPVICGKSPVNPRNHVQAFAGGRVGGARQRGPLVEFRILGPFEVVENGGSIALGGAQQRALLALLLLHRSEVLSTDRLIDGLWGEQAPATAAKVVQGHISRLRKALGDGVIVTQGRGYVLAVEPEQVDVRQFELLASEGRRALGGRDALRAREQLDAALGLWRGEPLTEFAYEPFAQREIARLQEARLAASEDRIEADLALGRDAEVIGELERLVTSNPLRERLRAQLMMALYRSGRQADALAVYRQTRELLREELGLEPGPTLKKIERMILDQDEALDAAPMPSATADSHPGVVCPFKGLAFFDRADVEYFCGRERPVSELVARLAESTLVGILGPSGIGKSSLLRAGVLPALSAGSLPRSAEWRQVLLRPGEDPCTALTRAVGVGGLREALARSQPGDRMVIAIDQLEELFTVCERDDERVRFLEQLAAAASDRERRVLIVCALRADFYGRISSYPRFAELLSRSHLLVGPMDRDELSAAIEQPAARAGLGVDRSLVDAMVTDVAGEPGGLPLLSSTLLELWRARDGRTLRLADYRRIGGVHGAVARLAEGAYGQLEEPERPVARTVLLRLATGDGDSLARRRVPINELERVEGAGRVVAILTDARLLTVSEGEVELSHEALLREWPRYRAWLEEDRDNRRVHAHLSAAAVEWDAQGRDPGELYRGARLSAALDWIGQHRDQLGPLEREFIDSSRRRAERDARRARGVLAGVVLLLLLALVAGGIALIQRHQATTQARVALGRELGAQALTEPRTDLAMLLAREAVNLDRSPQSERNLLATLLRSPAVIGVVPVPSDFPPQLAMSPDGRTLAASGYGFVRPDLRFYDPHSYASQRPPLTDFGSSQPPAYSGDGQLLAYRSIWGDIVVRDAHTLALRYKLASDQNLLSSASPGVDDGVQIARDNRTVYYAYSLTDAASNPRGAYLDRWSLPDTEPVSTHRIGSGAVLAMRLNDAGNRLLVVTAVSIRIFDAHSMRLLSSIPTGRASARASAAAISPTGDTIVIGSNDGSVSFLDPSTGAVRRSAAGHGGPVGNAVFTSGARTAITVADDDKVIIWNPATATPAETLTGPTGQVGSTAISPDGRTLYTSSLDGVLAWDLAGERGFGRRFRLGGVPPCCDPVAPATAPLATSPDGLRFAAAVGRSTVGLFSARTQKPEAYITIQPKNTVITALAWSPAGSELAVGGRSGALQLWNVDGSPRLVRPLVGLQSLPGRPEAIQAVAFSHSGTLVAASDLTQTAEIRGTNPGFLGNLAVWRTDTGRLVGPRRDLGIDGSGLLAFSPTGTKLAVSLPGPEGVLILDASTGTTLRTLHPAELPGAMAFAPDGMLAIGTVSGTAQLWDPASGRQAGPVLRAASAPLTSIAFDPRGSQFATTGYQDGTVRLWSTSTLRQGGTAFGVEQGTTSAAAFARDRLIALDDHGIGFIWPTSLSAWEQYACSVAGRNFTRGEWAQFVTGRAYTTVCP